MSELSKFGRAAIFYAEQGLPVYAPARGSKLPNMGTSGMAGRTSATATTDLEVIRQVYTDNPRNNVAIRLDQCDPPLCVIDTDTFAAHGKPSDEDKRDGDEVLSVWCEEHGVTLPKTITVITASGGRHRLYHYPDGFDQLETADNALTRVDFLGKGHGEVVPPSVINNADKDVHGVYRWEGDEPNIPDGIATLPTELYDLWKTALKEKSKRDGSNPKGRNTTLFDLCRAWYSEGYDEADVMRLAKEYNAALPDPLSDAEVEKTVRSAKKYRSKFSHARVGDELISRHHFKFIDGIPYTWTEGGYVCGWEALHTMIRTKIAKSVTRSQLAEIDAYLRDVAPKVKSVSEDAYRIAFANGVIDLRDDDLTLSENDPSFNIPVVIPHRFVREMGTSDGADPEFMKAIWAWADDRKEVAWALMEVIGLCMYRGGRGIAQAPFLRGLGHNGKSTLAALLRIVVGDGNHADLKPQVLGRRFQSVALMGKVANIADEVPFEAIDKEGFALLKCAITKDALPYERKGAETSVFQPFAQQVFTGNNVPKMPEAGRQVTRRFKVIPLDRDFTVCGDPNFDANLAREPFIETAIAYGIWHLKRVVFKQRGHMIALDTDALNASTMLANASSVYAFASDELGMKAESVTYRPTIDVYKEYGEYCQEHGRLKKGSNSFVPELCRILGIATARRRPERAVGERANPITMFVPT